MIAWSPATVASGRRSLDATAAWVRRAALEMALAGGKGHLAPAWSWVEIGVALYHGGVLRHRPSEPLWAGRDRFLLSKGHGCLTLYAILADRGFFPRNALARFVQPDGFLPGHPDPLIPGVEIVSGSLGHGLGVGAGLALAARRDRSDALTVVLLGDGECQEGSVAEAACFAAQHGLDHLVAIVDRNRLGSTARTADVMSHATTRARWESAGFEVRELNGHSFPALLGTLSDVRQRCFGQPLVLLADTVKGRGVSFMEDSPLWHHRLPRDEEIELARAELGGGPAAAFLTTFSDSPGVPPEVAP